MTALQTAALAAAGVMSAVCFALMGIDKLFAKSHARRIPEKTLFFFAIFMGGIGGTLGMWLFRHKTLHAQFKFGFPLLALAQIAIIVFTFGLK